MVQKLRGIILIDFGLIKSWFHYVRDQNLTFPGFLEFWTPGTPYLWISLHQNTSKNIRKYTETFEKHMSAYLYFHVFVNCGKDGHRKVMKNR